MITFPRITCNNLSLSIAIALWTIIQTLLHIYALLYIQWWRNCRLGNNENYFQFLFGDVSCDFNSSTIAIDLSNASELKYWITSELDTITFIYFIFNTLWLLTSVGLLTGACCVIREIWALVFYLPWVVMNIVILLYDVFCTIYFGVHVPANGTFLDWFNFLGLTSKINDVQHLENGSLDMIVGALAILMTFISAKAVVVWVANLIFLVLVIKIARIEYNTKYNQNYYRNCENRQNRPANVAAPLPEKRPIVRTNSQRVRDWHRFYDSVKYAENKVDLGDEEKYYDCIEDNNLFEANNFSVKNETKKNELLLSVHTYQQSVPSTSGVSCRKSSIAETPIGSAISEPSTSSANAFPKPRKIIIVTGDVDQDDSETDDDFKPSSDFRASRRVSK